MIPAFTVMILYYLSWLRFWRWKWDAGANRDKFIYWTHGRYDGRFYFAFGVGPVAVSAFEP